MKLKNTLALLLVAGACVSVVACSDGDTPPANVSYEVSAEEWHSALTFENVNNYKMVSTTGTVQEQTVEFDGATVHAVAKTGGEIRVDGYYRHESDGYYEYVPKENGKAYKGPIIKSEYDMMRTMQLELFTYDSFTYEETSKSYVAEEFVVLVEDRLLAYQNMSFQFANGKLTSITGTMLQGGYGASITTTVTYGTVSTIVLPEVEVVTTIDDEDMLEYVFMKATTSHDEGTVSLYANGGLVMQTKLNETAIYNYNCGIVSVNTVEDGKHYLYRDNNDGKGWTKEHITNQRGYTELDDIWDWFVTSYFGLGGHSEYIVAPEFSAMTYDETEKCYTYSLEGKAYTAYFQDMNLMKLKVVDGDIEYRFVFDYKVPTIDIPQVL